MKIIYKGQALNDLISRYGLKSLYSAAITHTDDSITFDSESPAYKTLSRPARVAKLSPEKRRENWKKALPTWQAAKAYAKAKLSKSAAAVGLIPPLSPETRRQRQLSCHGNSRTPPCPARAYSTNGKFHYCNECACGEKEDARLSARGSGPDSPIFTEEDADKFSHPYLECPRKREGFSNHRSKDSGTSHVIIRHNEGLGDATCLTAVIRDYKLSFPRDTIEVRGWPWELYKGIPYIEAAHGFISPALGHRSTDGEILIEVYLNDMPNYNGLHLIDKMHETMQAKTGKQFPLTNRWGDLRLTAEERTLADSLPFSGKRYWLINAGTKRDGNAITVKQPDIRELQKVVDHFLGRIKFVQIGSKHHFHPLLNNVIDYRELKEEHTYRKALWALYDAEGVVTPISWMTHAAPALELPPEKAARGFVRRGAILAGGREPKWLVDYPNNVFLDTFGELDCCREGPCWKKAVEKRSGKGGSSGPLCLDVVQTNFGQPIARCQELITADRIIAAIESNAN